MPARSKPHAGGGSSWPPQSFGPSGGSRVCHAAACSPATLDPQGFQRAGRGRGVCRPSFPLPLISSSTTDTFSWQTGPQRAAGWAVDRAVLLVLDAAPDRVLRARLCHQSRCGRSLCPDRTAGRAARTSGVWSGRADRRDDGGWPRRRRGGRRSCRARLRPQAPRGTHRREAGGAGWRRVLCGDAHTPQHRRVA